MVGLPTPGSKLGQIERAVIHHALEETVGNVGAAARLLGVDRKVLERGAEDRSPPDGRPVARRAGICLRAKLPTHGVPSSPWALGGRFERVSASRVSRSVGF